MEYAERTRGTTIVTSQSDGLAIYYCAVGRKMAKMGECTIFADLSVGVCWTLGDSPAL